MNVALACVGGFLCGSIPFGFLIGKLFYGIDIRKSGSGNIGAANALRTMGKAGAAVVLFLDAAKGFAPVFVVLHTLAMVPAGAAAVGCATVIGHVFSPWLGWRGGKGVATSIGVIIALSWIAGIICIGAWVVGAVGTGYSSVGSLAANIVAPLALWLVTREVAFAAYGIFAAAFIPFTHRENIVRLRRGRENRLPLWRDRASTRANWP